MSTGLYLLNLGATKLGQPFLLDRPGVALKRRGPMHNPASGSLKTLLGAAGGDLVGAVAAGELDEVLVELEPDAVVAVDAG